MEPRLTRHAQLRLETRRVTLEEIAAVLERPDRTTYGARNDVRYDARVGGRIIRVVVDRDSEPALVITFFELESDRG